MFHSKRCILTPQWRVIKYQTCVSVIKHPKHHTGVIIHLYVLGYPRMSLNTFKLEYTQTSFLTVYTKELLYVDISKRKEKDY